MKIIYVKWADASTHFGWIDCDEIPVEEMAECESIGFLFHEDEDKLVLVQSIGGDDVNGYIKIPKGWIRKRKYLKI